MTEVKDAGLSKVAHFVLSAMIFIGAINVAFSLAEGYLVVSGRIQPGQTIEYFERPAREFSELAVSALVSLTVICFALLAQRGLKRASAAEKPKSSGPPGADRGPG